MDRTYEYPNGWKHRHSDIFTWHTAAWHDSHFDAIILLPQGKRREYYIHPYARDTIGLDYTLCVGPFKTLGLAKVQLLMGNTNYYATPQGLYTRGDFPNVSM